MKKKEELKVCVYTICKNESKFVERWLDSMQEADYIVVLDTGSTDGTYEKLKADPRVTRVEQKTYTPWRFDIPRNDSMDLAPEDTDILISTDLDEILTEGWCDALKEQWATGEYVRGNYQYAWSHTSTGENDLVFWYDKIHVKGYRWKFPVHEILECPNQNELEDKGTLKLDERVFLHHYPDDSKSRGSYLGLLELRYQENPDDIYSMFYLGREYTFYGQDEKAIEILEKVAAQTEYWNILNIGSYILLGKSYKKLGKMDQAVKCFYKIIENDPTFIEGYVLLADIFSEKQLYTIAIGLLNEGLAKARRHYTWIEDSACWTYRPYDLLSIAYYYTGEVEKGKEYLLKAIEMNPTDQRLRDNLKFYL